MKAHFPKILLFAVFQLFTLSANSQINETFLDGDFSTNPTWSGDAGQFLVNPDKQLQLNSLVADVSSLSTPFVWSDSTEWKFLVKLNFAPSTTNLMRFYLSSSVANLEGPLNGYFIRIGNTGLTDGVELWRQSGTTLSQVGNFMAGKAAINPNFRIKVQRRPGGNWRVWADTLGNNSFVLAGTATDNTHTNSAFIGPQCRYTASNGSAFLFDDIMAGPILADITPPQLVSASVISGTSLELVFNEPILVDSANIAAKYSVSAGVGAPISAQLQANNTSVRLVFGQNLLANIQLTISAKGQTDLAGNIASTQSTTFTYSPPFEPTWRQLVINEIFFDETPQVGLPLAEFVELYNNSGQAINLSGYRLADATSTSLIGNHIMPAGSYLTLCATSQLSAFAAFGPALAMSLPSLNNTGETLSLSGPQGQKLDEISYSPSWIISTQKRDGGWSLEQKNPITLCSGPANWAVSNDAKGGTPSSQNSIFSTLPDQIAPRLLAIVVVSASQIRLDFSESMDSTDLKTASLTLTPNLPILSRKAIGPDYRSVLIDLVSPTISGQPYQLSIQNWKDCPGNPMSQPASLGFGRGQRPNQPYQVLITEVYADESPSNGLPESEFLEIYNPTALIIDLSGCTISDQTSTTRLTNLQILPGQYIVLCPSSAAIEYQAYGTAVGVSSFPSLNSESDHISLRGQQGQFISSVEYEKSWYNDIIKQNGGWSLEMVDVQNPCLGSANWNASQNPLGGTPAKANSIGASIADNTHPRLIKAVFADSVSLILQFDEPFDSLLATSATISTIPVLNITKVGIEKGNFKQIMVKLAQPPLPNQKFMVKVSAIADCKNNTGFDLATEFVRPIVALDNKAIMLNEILFNPRTTGADFIELYNGSDDYLDLKNWKLTNTKDTANLGLGSLVFEPKKYLVLTTDSQAIIRQYPKSKGKNFMIVKNLPSMPDDKGPIVLLNGKNQEMQRLDYSDKMHFQLLDNDEGVSLERMSLEIPSNQSANWASAAEQAGFATPGFANSQSINVPLMAKNGISIFPESFSPDGDGFNDATVIGYTFEKAGLLANVHIYDVAGKRIRRISANTTLANEGFFQWDGLTDTQSKAPVGLYLVLMEAIEINGKIRYYKKPVAIGAKF